MSDIPVEGPEWHAYLVPLGVRSSDGRELAADGAAWRPLPLPLMLMEENDYGHDGSVIAATIQTIEERDGMLYATGQYGPGEPGARARELVETQTLRWVSVDVEALEWEEWLEIDGVRVDDIDALDDDDWLKVKWVEILTKWNVMGATITAFPAFPQAVIAPITQELDIVDGLNAAAELGVITACGYEGDPPLEVFANPNLSQLTPLTVTDDGRVFGHVAGWNIAHIGFPGKQIYAPRSASSYAHFTTGALRTAEGEQIAVGQITLGTGHADLQMDHRSAASHYDNTGTAVADIATGEDEHGIWFAGALRPGVTPEQARELRASALSGDWRQIGGNLELVGVLAVNVGGFPIPRPTIGMAASGEVKTQRSLVAAGLVSRKTSIEDIESRMARFERLATPLVDSMREGLKARVSTTPKK